MSLADRHRRGHAGFLLRNSILLWFSLLPSVAIAQSGFPFTNENLHYSITWPSGLSLGEGHLRAKRIDSANGKSERWQFELGLDASVPGVPVSDHFRSESSSDFCSLEFEKDSKHGPRKATETTVFDQSKLSATRTTRGGGRSELSVPACAKDALTFLFYARRELGQGRVPPAQTIFFGGTYQIRLEYTGAQTIPVSDKKLDADRVLASVKSPASEISFEMFFARDAARTPVLVRVPFSLGIFSLELVR
jgi:hypothetical protein